MALIFMLHHVGELVVFLVLLLHHVGNQHRLVCIDRLHQQALWVHPLLEAEGVLVVSHQSLQQLLVSWISPGDQEVSWVEDIRLERSTGTHLGSRSLVTNPS